MTRITRPPRLVAAAAVCAVVLAACGDSDESSDADEPAVSTAPIDATAETTNAPPTTAAPTTVASDGADHDHEDHDHEDHDHDEQDHEGQDQGDDAAVEVDEPELRLVVADAVDPVVRVVRYSDGDVIGTLDMPGTVAVSDAGRYTLAAARADDRLEVVDPGTWTEPHGDHFHSFVAAPTLTAMGFDVDDPTHVVGHGDLIAVFNDGDGSVMVLDETALSYDDAVVATFDSGAAHHGVAVALAEHGVVLVTTPVEGESLPDGVAVVDLETGDELQRFPDCPGLHGEAATEAFVAFGCTDGVLILEPHDDHWDARKIDRPAGSADDARTGTLAASGDTLVGNLGGGALAVIDLAGGTATAIDLPVEMRGFSLAPDGTSIVVLTIDGQVHLIDPATGAIDVSAPIVDAFELPEGHGAAPIPQLVVAEGHIFVTDPTDGALVELDAGLAEVRRFDVGGAPAGVVVAG